jgi:hypothetical protein
MTRMLFKKAYWEDGYRVYLSTAGTSSDPRSQVKPCGKGKRRDGGTDHPHQQFLTGAKAPVDQADGASDQDRRPVMAPLAARSIGQRLLSLRIVELASRIATTAHIPRPT